MNCGAVASTVLELDSRSRLTIDDAAASDKGIAAKEGLCG